MSTIEQAILRLAALKSAGVGVATDAPPAPRPSSMPPPSMLEHTPLDAAVSGTLAAIDLAKLQALGVITPDAPRTRLSDEFRVIKRPIIGNARGKSGAIRHGNLVMVTSTLPGEGKSFAALNLAMSLAQEQDSSVLLVDADVARPSIMRLCGLPQARGLMDVLSGEAALNESVLPTNVDKLALLPAGMPHERATEMLASRVMQRVLEALSAFDEDRIVVFDSPPLLATTEARVLASHMGQIVMVVEAARTATGLVQQALATIASCPVKLMLLNKQPGGAAGEYAHREGYGYGYGAPL